VTCLTFTGLDNIFVFIIFRISVHTNKVRRLKMQTSEAVMSELDVCLRIQLTISIRIHPRMSAACPSEYRS